MADYGLLPTGFVPKTAEIVRDSLDERARGRFSPSLPLGDKTFFGHVHGAIAYELGLLWELAQTVYSSQDADAASGTALEQLSLLTGTFRRDAEGSTAVVTFCGTPTTVVPTALVVKTSLGQAFETFGASVIAALTAWAGSTMYDVGDRVTNAGRCYQCIIAGESHAHTGPTTTSEDETDEDAHWTYLGEGTGAVDATLYSSEDGPIEAGPRDLTEIQNPTAGLNTALNLAAANVGRLEDTDEVLRLRREIDLVRPGDAVPAAIRQAVLDLDGVTSCRVFYNNTDVTDVDGVPPHSVEVLVQGGLDQDIRDALLASVAAGIATHGTVTGTSVDEEGEEVAIEFSRPTPVTIYVTISLIIDADIYPADGDDQVKAAIVAWGEARQVGDDVVATRAGAQAYSVDGVLDVPRSGSLGGTLIKTSSSPTADTTIVVGNRQIATWDVSRISVSTTPGAP